jgi:peptidoglycan hydrolase CwlO-like protein
MSGLRKTIRSSLLLLFLLFASVGAFTQESEPPTWNDDIETLKQNLLSLERKYKNAMFLLENSNSTIEMLQKSVSDGQKEIEGLKKSTEELQRQLLDSKADYQVFSQDLKKWDQTLVQLDQNWKEVTQLYSKVLLYYNEYKEAVDKKIADLEAQRNLLFWVSLGELLAIIGLGILKLQ